MTHSLGSDSAAPSGMRRNQASLHDDPTVFVIDAFPLIRSGFRGLIEREGWKFAGEASTVEEAYDSIVECRPALIIVDLRLGSGDGASALARLRTASPNSNILVVANREEPAFIEFFLMAGASGYVCKSERSETIIEAMQSTMSGRVYVDQRTADVVLDRVVHKRLAFSIESALTPREREVYSLIGNGQDVKQIARTLRLSAKTVEYHRQQLKRKLGLKSSSELMRHAIVHLRETSRSPDERPGEEATSEMRRS